MITTDERQRLTRLIELTPPGARRTQYEARLTQLATASGTGELAALRAERDRLLARWEKGCDFLDDLRERTGQDSPEFDRYFAEWERIDADLRGVLDRIEIAEMNERIKREGLAPVLGDDVPYPVVA
jgi:hypothetical protein